jgi:general secretion pathway protein N
VVLAEARGSVWDGSARLQFAGGAGSRDQTVLPGRIQWQLRPAWQGVNMQVHADCCTPSPLALQLKARWGGAQLVVQDPASPSNWPAALLIGLGAPWNTLQIDGRLLLSTHDLTIAWAQGRPSLSGSAELRALDMSSRLSTLKPMGSYRMQLQGGDTPTLQVSTIEGSLQLSGSGRWVGARLHFAGEASAAPNREAALANLLNILGRRQGARTLIAVG